MFYSNGNYEAFIRPRKPQGVDGKSAYLIGGGIASLSAAGFLIRDGQMDGKRITIYEASNICGGCLDGIEDPKEGFLFRGEREMEDHYECLWDLMRSIPSLDVKGASVLEDYYQINKDYPNYSLCRTTHKRGQPFPTDGKMLLTPKSQDELMKLFYTHRRELYDKRFDEFVSEEFFKSNFWLYWLSMFAIGPWHGALEMKLYMQRFVQHFGGMADLSTIKFTRLNQYDSLILPLVKWLEQQGVTIRVRHEGHQRRVRHHPGTQDRAPDRVDPGRKARRTRRHQERPRPHYQWLCGRKQRVGGPPHPAQVEQGHPGGQHLGDVAQHRRPGPRLR